MKPRLTAALSQPLRGRPLYSSLRASRLPRCQPQLLQSQQLQQTRPMTSAPRTDSGPLMERRADRELPDISSATRRWLLTAPVFLLLCGLSAAAIFNYEKSSSSVVSATLYSLRTHPQVRQLLGDEIYFRDRWPWVWGELNQVHGRIDIGYGVKGTRAKGYMRFKAVRPSRAGFFETREWSLQLEDGTVLQLLEDERGRDPFGKEVQEAER